MHQFILGLYMLMEIIKMCSCEPTVKMDINLFDNSIKLSCLVKNKVPRKSIYLSCPLKKTNCMENCASTCVVKSCKPETVIKCEDRGLDTNSGFYQIDYIIDRSIRENGGKWQCHYGGGTSVPIYVNVSSSETLPPVVGSFREPVKPKDGPDKALNEGSTKEYKKDLRDPPVSNRVIEEHVQNDKVLTKSEFILTVIFLLAISLIINVVFGIILIVGHCGTKKKVKENSRYSSMNHHHPILSHSISQVSDTERIYEDASIHARQLSFLSQIQNGNGKYVASKTLTPHSGLSTLLPQVPYSNSFTLPLSPADTGNQPLNYPILSDSAQGNIGNASLQPTENNYTNFVSVQPEMCLVDGTILSQPVYLSFPSGHPMMTAGSRYLQYSSQPLQSMAPSTTEGRSTRIGSDATSTLPQSSNKPQNTQDDGKSNYQLSREMMEEADNLLRTADTLLKSTESEMKFYQ